MFIHRKDCPSLKPCSTMQGSPFVWTPPIHCQILWTVAGVATQNDSRPSSNWLGNTNIHRYAHCILPLKVRRHSWLSSLTDLFQIFSPWWKKEKHVSRVELIAGNILKGLNFALSETPNVTYIHWPWQERYQNFCFHKDNDAPLKKTKKLWERY